jgi:mono/diheme cytochrome c family protein
LKKRTKKRLVMAGLAIIGARPAHADQNMITLYTLHCSGCHGANGHGIPDKGIPDLHESGSYVALPAGRAYLVQVPGLSQSRLDDATAARLLNYVLQRFSADQLPPGFAPYTTQEITALRADKASDAETRRHAILSALHRPYPPPP